MIKIDLKCEAIVKSFFIQCKPLNAITLGQAQTDNIK